MESIMAKDKVQQTENAETPVAPNEPIQDEYTGKGGSYIFDPETGKRTPNPD
jgi:hypothetical protein